MERAAEFGNRPMGFTVDVEDYYQVGAFFDCIPRSEWHTYESRVVKNTLSLSDMLIERGFKGTFFILGHVAEQHPELVKALYSAGHEIACHGHYHHRVCELTPEQFKHDILRAKNFLEDVISDQVKGYRAPCFSVSDKTPYAFDVIAEAGFLYSSSTYPVKHDHYGTPTWPAHPFYEKNTGILEIPQAVAKIAGRNIPAGGGGYFRLLPNYINKTLIKTFHSQQSHSYAFYCHPWEIDPEQPRIKNASAKSKFRHYVNLGAMEKKIKDLLSWGQFERMDVIYTEELKQSRNTQESVRGVA